MEQRTSWQSIDQIDFTPRKQMHPSPHDWRDHFIYFLLVDRFDDNKWRIPYWGSRKKRQQDIRKGIGVHGGNLKGVKSRLKYLKSLGITTIWLSPVFKNRVDQGGSLHGYAIQDFLEVDPHFGTKKDLCDLVDAAHRLGMYIILDIVINHTADNWAYEGDAKPPFSTDGTRYPFGFWRSEHNSNELGPDDAVWPAELQDPDCYTRRGVIDNWNNATQAVQGDFFNLKDLDLNYLPTLKTLTAIYKYWIVETNIDGYRVDTVKHVDNEPSVKFFNAIKEFTESIGKQNFLIFGEIVDGDAVIAKYVGNQTVNNEQIQALDASLDFPLYFVLDEVIKRRLSPAALRKRYEVMRDTYQHSDGSDLLVTFIDNHDQMSRPYHRFLFDAEDTRQAILGVGYLLTTLGIPSIYYGTEQGFNGGGEAGAHQDNFIRECMFGGRWGAFGTRHWHFFNKRYRLYRAIAETAQVRATEPTLRYGRLYFREISKDGVNFHYPELNSGFLAFSRIHDDTEIVMVMNLRAETDTNHVMLDGVFSPPGTALVDLLDSGRTYLTTEGVNSSVVRITLEPYGMVILKKEKRK